MTPVNVFVALTWLQIGCVPKWSPARISLAGSRWHPARVDVSIHAGKFNSTLPFSDKVQFQQSFKEVVSFVPVCLVASMLRGAGGGRSGGSTERPREGGREKKKTNNNIWAHFNRLDLRRAVKPLIQIARVWVVSSARLTCSGRPASFQSEKDRAGRRARSRCDRCVRARARVWSWGINGADFYPLAHTPRRLHACMRAPPVLKLYGILRRAVQQWKLPPEELRGTRECPFVAQFGKCDFYPCPTN